MHSEAFNSIKKNRKNIGSSVIENNRPLLFQIMKLIRPYPANFVSIMFQILSQPLKNWMYRMSSLGKTLVQNAVLEADFWGKCFPKAFTFWDVIFTNLCSVRFSLYRSCRVERKLWGKYYMPFTLSVLEQ